MFLSSKNVTTFVQVKQKQMAHEIHNFIDFVERVQNESFNPIKSQDLAFLLECYENRSNAKESASNLYAYNLKASSEVFNVNDQYTEMGYSSRRELVAELANDFNQDPQMIWELSNHLGPEKPVKILVDTLYALDKITNNGWTSKKRLIGFSIFCGSIIVLMFLIIFNCFL